METRVDLGSNVNDLAANVRDLAAEYEEEPPDSSESESENLSGKEDMPFTRRKPQVAKEILFDGFEFGSDAEDDEVAELREKVEKVQNRLRKGIPITYSDSMYYSDSDGDGGENPANDGVQDEDHDEGFESDEIGSYDDTDVEDETADHGVRRKSRFVQYNPNTEKPYFDLGMVFRNMVEVRVAANKHSIKECKDLKFKKNESKRFRAVCKFKGCTFCFFVSYDRTIRRLQLKTLEPHTCPHHWRNSRVKANYVAEKYKRLISSNPQLKIRELRAIVREDVGSDVYGSCIGRVKNLVLKKTARCYADEFALLWTYAEEMRKSDPGTTVKIKVDRGNPENQPLFQRMYVGFASLRRGFLGGCRRILGLDGCFLKGLCKGELLAAIGRDANDQMYPVAWAIVEVESRDSWSWFLELLASDLNMADGGGWTLSSDQQKGLIPAIAELLPSAEHRLCARHIFCNWRKKHKNLEWQYIFWECAKATTVMKFSNGYKKLESKNKEAAVAMVHVPKEQWCKAFFSTVVKCDSVDNNMSETFNASIVEARHKPPYSMFDEIRRLTIERIVKKQEAASKWKGPICPKIMKKYGANAEESRKCRVITCGNQEYEVDHGEERYKVRIGDGTCTCRAWDLSGIPCPHAITCIVSEGKEPFTFISDWYSVAKYIATYSSTMPAMEGPRQWFPVDMDPIQPPAYRPMPGRPKKKRRLTADELLQPHKTKPHKLGRAGRIMICTNCQVEGHNSSACKSELGQSPNSGGARAATTEAAGSTATTPVGATAAVRAARGRGRGAGGGRGAVGRGAGGARGGGRGRRRGTNVDVERIAGAFLG